MKNKICCCILIMLLSYCLFIFYMYPITGKVNEELLTTCVPKLNPFDKSILQFIAKPENITCSPNGPLVDSDLNYLYVNNHLLIDYGVYHIKKFHCCYRTFERKVPEEWESDDEIIYMTNCKPFITKAKIEAEFVEVFCRYRRKIIYHDMHSFVPVKNNSKKFTNTQQKLNVLIFGIDALSHMNFQRQMPKTKKYIDENLNSVLMLGYNKVDDNTFPNLMPIFTGHSMNEIMETCWKTKYVKFDNCNFIWNDYSDAGYLTAFAEDSSNMGLFNMDRLGFQVQPTHYYWRTFCYYAEVTIGTSYCIGPRLSHKVLLEYVKKFTSSLKDEPFFGIFWSCTLTHDCLNCPSLSDEDYVEFFDGLKRDNVLNNTVVIFLSDHGIRTGDILQTYQGYMEERLPLLYFIFPPWFNELYPMAIKNMRENSIRLTANFDIYKTILDLLDVNKLKTKYLENNQEAFVGKRGISLFSLVPENRSCEMAGIPSHWCTCKKRNIISKNDQIVESIAKFIVSHLNKLMILYDNCAVLRLHKINGATVAKSTLRNNIVSKEYTITLQAKPSDAIFESTVRCTGTCSKEDFYEISGVVSRLNKYGNQSSCISHHLLRMYCYCI